MSDSEREVRQDRPAATRRDFLDRLLAVGAVVWGCGVAVPAAAYLWPARLRGPGQEVVDAGSIDDFPVGSARIVPAGGRPILVLRLGPNEFRALSAICTHLGCIVHWNAADKVIACPCHAGVFASDGSRISGPPPRALQTYGTTVVGKNQLRVVM